MGKIRKFKNRKPSLPFPWVGVELQFYIRFPEGDETKIYLNEKGEEVTEILMFAYKEHKLPWRTEFGKQAEWDDEGNPIKKSYIDQNYEVLLTEAKQI